MRAVITFLWVCEECGHRWEGLFCESPRVPGRGVVCEWCRMMPAPAAPSLDALEGLESLTLELELEVPA